MTTRLDQGFDDGPEFEPDDPLAVILRPGSGYLGPPPGRFEAIRRTAARRRGLRAAAGAGLACAVAALVALPVLMTKPETNTPPSIPLAPPPTFGSTAPPAPRPSGVPSVVPSDQATTGPSAIPETSAPATQSGADRPGTATPVPKRP